MKTIAVQLTAPGTGAISVVALAGEKSMGIVRQIAGEKKISRLFVGETIRAALLDADATAPIDDALILRIAEDHVEIHVHGGRAVVDALLAALQNAGAEKTSIETAAALGFFGTTLHAEIATTLPSALTMTAARLIATQGSEGLHAWSTHWQRGLDKKIANDLWRFHSAVQWILQRSATLAKLLYPPRLAIIGPPNAGKSTLANALLGRPIAITSEIAGTTRDWIDALATFTHGDIHIPVLLIDTAGVRETIDPLEKTSIARTHEQAAQADIILLLFDASRQPTPEELQLIDTYDPARLLIAANKTDAGRTALAILRARAPALLEISAKNQINLDALMSAALAKLDLASVFPDESFAFTARQVALLAQLSHSPDASTAVNLLKTLVD